MSKQIEVEIRGRLDNQSYEKLKSFLDKNSNHLASQEREMFLLQDYPGYSRDFVNRQVDIRLRNTDGNCEVMTKGHVGGAREEVALKLQDNDLETAKRMTVAAKELGLEVLDDEGTRELIGRLDKEANKLVEL